MQADFQQFQRAFGSHLRDPHHVPRPAGTPERRVGVYRELVFNNLCGFVDSCFLVCRQLFGEVRWRRLCCGFLRDWPMHSPWFREVPGEFARYLGTSGIAQPLPRWLPELAHYEWAELAVDVMEAPRPQADPARDPMEAEVGIAVLPFDNLSPDPDNAFFAGGVYEEVLTKLSRIGELRVISRTSMEQIAKQDLQVGTIGQRLGVSHVLEGSVRKAGDQIRVTVQLIEAASDNHIWAENYDRKLDDVFAIQSEIALAIANQLKLSLSSELQANLSERPTQNQAAYALYLQGAGRAWHLARKRRLQGHRRSAGTRRRRDEGASVEPCVVLLAGNVSGRRRAP